MKHYLFYIDIGFFVVMKASDAWFCLDKGGLVEPTVYSGIENKEHR